MTTYKIIPMKICITVANLTIIYSFFNKANLAAEKISQVTVHFIEIKYSQCNNWKQFQIKMPCAFYMNEKYNLKLELLAPSTLTKNMITNQTFWCYPTETLLTFHPRVHVLMQ